MAYNTRYLFKFDSQNGVAYEIHIMEDGYTGEVVQRALGASPIYRRDNNEHIGGTSLEILAECINDGEFTVIYTSDPYRFKVVLYQNGTAIWSGFAKPEMYSEPDIAPPYDVSITAIDGLGELKRNNYEAQGDAAIGDILSFVLSKTGLDLPLNYISSISAVTPTAIGADDILSVVVNLDHMVGESCYYVLQAILSTLNADITQLNNSWLIVRQSDIAIENDSVSAYSWGGGSVTLPISYFGSMDSYQWWPIGQMQTEIIPAKRKVVVTAENAFKENVMPGSWNIGEGATEDESEGAYSLTRLDASIDQTVRFGGEIEYRLLLSIAARNNGSGEEIGKLGLQITTEGTSSGGSRTYYLAQSASAGTARRKMNSYLWSASESSIEVELQAPAASDTASDAETIDIVIPFYRSGPRSFMRGSSLSVRIYNADGLYSQYVYDVVLSRYEQALGYQDTLNVDNGAREDASEASVLFGVINDSLENTFQYYIPMDSFGATVETWMSADVAETDYLSLIARDYAKGVALPRVSKVGKLNVGGTVGIPSLFVDSDGAAYWPLTFSWNLLNDEFDVNLRSLPLANISIESEEVTPIQGGSTSSSRATGGGGGASYLNDLLDVNTDSVTTQSVLYYNGTEWVGRSLSAILNGYAKSADLLTLSNLLASMWSIDEQGNLVTEKQVIIKNNLIVEGDTASGGDGGGSSVGIQGIVVNGTTYRDTDGDGLIDLGTIGGGTITEITSTMIVEALGYTPANSASLGSLAYKNGLTASEVGALSASGGIIYSNDVAPLILSSFSDQSRLEFYIADQPRAIIGWRAEHGAWLFNYNGGGNYIGVKDDGTPHYNGNTLYHSGNFNPADYLPLSGGTITGYTTIRTNSFGNQLCLDITDNSANLIRFQRNGANLGFLGFYTENVPIFADKQGARNILLHSGNYSDYALPRTGGILDGSLQIGKDDNTAYNYMRLVREGYEMYVNCNAYGGYISYGAIGAANAQLRLVSDSITFNGNTLIHSGNIGEYKAGDSDKLGGLSASSYARNILGDGLNIDAVDRQGLWGGKLYQGSGTTPTNVNAPFLEYGMVGYYGQFTNWSNALYFRGCNNGTWKAWKTIAFTDSNVASATKLATARTIWGQSFDGTGNVLAETGVGLMSSKSYFGLSILPMGNPYWGVRTFLTYDEGATMGAFEITARHNRGLTILHGGGSAYDFDSIPSDLTYTSLVEIRPSGNVLIGTTTDNGAKLGIEGSMVNLLSLKRTAQGAGAFIDYHANNDSENQWRVGHDYGSSGSSFKFIKLNGTSEQTLMTIKSSGNVGIGTTDPAYKLDVNGTGRFTGAVTMDSTLNVSGALSSSTGVLSKDYFKVSGTGASVSGLYTNSYISSENYPKRLWLYNDDEVAIYGSEIQLRNNTTIKGNLVVQGDISA